MTASDILARCAAAGITLELHQRNDAHTIRVRPKESIFAPEHAELRALMGEHKAALVAELLDRQMAALWPPVDGPLAIGPAPRYVDGTGPERLRAALKASPEGALSMGEIMRACDLSWDEAVLVVRGCLDQHELQYTKKPDFTYHGERMYGAVTYRWIGE
ncbi:MAG: hypothetical protein KGL39_49130 [Patescibacteria group bacterium]|nr:hypothetical protein [Patescibacteria group bacterium]